MCISRKLKLKVEPGLKSRLPSQGPSWLLRQTPTPRLRIIRSKIRRKMAPESNDRWAREKKAGGCLTESQRRRPWKWCRGCRKSPEASNTRSGRSWRKPWGDCRPKETELPSPPTSCFATSGPQNSDKWISVILAILLRFVTAATGNQYRGFMETPLGPALPRSFSTWAWGWCCSSSG